jgi:hypothetical protein
LRCEKVTKENGCERYMEGCSICCENLNKSSHRPVTCARCHAVACRACVARYLLGSLNDPDCMACHHPWDRDFLFQHMTKSFMNKGLKAHREAVLFEREVALLPTSQYLVERWRRAEMLREESRALMERIDKIREVMKNRGGPEWVQTLEETNYPPGCPVHTYQAVAFLGRHVGNLYNEVWGLRTRIRTLESVPREKPQQAQFIKACPAEGCRGFLSKGGWVCGTCSSSVCRDCHEVKEEGHECSPDLVASAKFIQNDTRPCPNCASLIHKIDGCFAIDTPILMWDGSIKMSQDICGRDVLVGDDGHPRTVQEVFQGEDAMYEVTQHKGRSYTVNSKHVLVLKFSGDREVYWSNDGVWKVRWFDPLTFAMKTRQVRVAGGITKEGAKKEIEDFVKTLEHPYTYEMTVEQYISLSPSTQKHLMGVKAEGIHWQHQDINLDPYMLGLDSREAETAANDNEVLEYLLEWFKSNGAELVHAAPFTYRTQIFGSSENRDGLYTNISVRTIGHGRYFGWRVDGNMRFVLPDLTVVRNCSQIWCTQCHTAFDYRTGQVVTSGPIHNPHYYEWLRQQHGGAAPRNPGDVPCGGDAIPHARDLLDALRSRQQGGDEENLMTAHRCALHVRHHILPQLARPGYDPDHNAPLRVEYLIGRTDAAGFKKKLQMREKKRAKQVSLRQVYEMLVATCGDILHGVVSGDKLVEDVMKELGHLEDYTNMCLRKVAQQFGAVEPELVILRRWR